MTTRGTYQDLHKYGITLREGLILDFWMDDEDDEGNPDPLYFQGELHHDETLQHWVAVVVRDNIYHVSELTAGDNIMELTYTLEKNDYLYFNGFVINRVPALKRQMVLRFVFLPALIALEAYFVRASLPWFLLSVAVFTGIWAGYLLWAQRRAITVQAQSRPGALGLHTVSLQPDGFYTQSSVLDTRAKWLNITEIADSPQMIILLLSPRFGFIVPKRAFAGPAQAAAFLETAQAYRQSAYDGTQPMLPSIPASWPPAPQRIS